MSDSNNVSYFGGIGLPAVLFVVFLVLKLTDHIDWAWWWATAPRWIPWGIFLGILLIVGVIWGIVWGIDSLSKWNSLRSRNKFEEMA